jgi:hypothetical protein
MKKKMTLLNNFKQFIIAKFPDNDTSLPCYYHDDEEIPIGTNQTDLVYVR